MKNKISILIPTTDHYSNVWEGLGLSWEVLSGLDLNIYVVSDNQKYNYDYKNIIPLTISKPDYTKSDFSNKLIYALDKIKTKYVLLMCDDMWPDRSLKDAIWNVDYLKSIQHPNEDPWENEVLGTKRAELNAHNQYHYNMRWYLQHHNFHRGEILPYGQAFIDDLKYKKEFNKQFSI